MGEELLVPKDVARLLGVRTHAVYELIERMEIEAIDVGLGSTPRWRISRDALAAFQRDRKNPAGNNPT